MDARRRLVFYLLINIFVSALVTGTIIFFYDRAHRLECNPNLLGSPAVTPQASDVNVSIVGIIGTGAVTDERVVIQNAGSQQIILTGWYLEDNKGVTYTFPQVTLYPGAKLQVYTKAGTDTLPDLYWGRSESVWTPGELVALYDSQNIVRAFYRVP